MPSPRRNPRFRASAAALLLLAGALGAGCAARRPSVLPELGDRAARPTVVLIPGITGSRLVDRATGRVVWGTGRNLLRPHDGGRRLVRPVDGGGDALEPAGVLTRVPLPGPFHVSVYEPIVRALRANGYTVGDLSAPRPGDDLLLFSWDWRAGVAAAAARLGDQLERLARERGSPRLDVVLLCHSDASSIARWFVKYGTSTLEEAEAGRERRPPGVRPVALVLMANANGGALGTLEDLLHGRTYFPVLGRRFRPEVLFTFPSLYEALPAYTDDLFFDADGRRVAVDLFDAATWRDRGWSAFDPAARRRIDRHPDAGFGSEDERFAWLARALDHARRVQLALHRDVPGFPPVRYVSIQNAYRPTPARALLLPGGGGRNVVFSGKRVKSDPVRAARASDPGDGHATIASQSWLSPQETAALDGPPRWVPAGHRALVRHPATLAGILDALAAAAARPSADATPSLPTSERPARAARSARRHP